MQKINLSKVFRVIDANFNRCKEGLRVIEDIFRFILEDNALRKKTRAIRHALDEIKKNPKLRQNLLAARDVQKDSGKKVDYFEIKRKNTSDILYVNIQRVKESLRVLEEFFKIIDKCNVPLLKKSRYELYEIERKSFKKWFS